MKLQEMFKALEEGKRLFWWGDRYEVIKSDKFSIGVCLFDHKLSVEYPLISAYFPRVYIQKEA